MIARLFTMVMTGLMSVLSAQAINYSADVSQARWQVDRSPFE